jgi:hypothetical protein
MISKFDSMIREPTSIKLGIKKITLRWGVGQIPDTLCSRSEAVLT